jgi:hypothetical protein
VISHLAARAKRPSGMLRIAALSLHRPNRNARPLARQTPLPLRSIRDRLLVGASGPSVDP